MRQPSSTTSSFNCPWMSRHSRIRLKDRKCTRQASCSLRLDFLCSSASSKNFQSLSHERKSDLSSLKRFCASSAARSEEHTSELQSRLHLVCRLLLEKKKKISSSVY